MLEAKNATGSIAHAREDCPPRFTSSWDELLKQDPNHEPHLDSPLGRFQAILNILHSGLKIETTFALTDSFDTYTNISKRINRSASQNLSFEPGVRQILISTLEPVGAAAKGDRENKTWKQTSFGKDILPALIYASIVMIDLDINSLRALSSQTIARKSPDGSLSTTPPFERALTLLQVEHGKRISDFDNSRISFEKIASHLQVLAEEGLVNYQPIDNDKGYVAFRISPEGAKTTRWLPYVEHRKRGSDAFTTSSAQVELALIGLSFEGKDFPLVMDVAKRPEVEATYDTVRNILNHFAKIGMLEKNKLDKYKNSDTSLTEKGEAFATLLTEILSFCNQPNSVPEINVIRGIINIKGPQAFPELHKTIGERFIQTSPYKSPDRSTKVPRLLQAIATNNGSLCLTDICSMCKINSVTAARLLKPYFEQGVVVATMKLFEGGVGQGGKKQYLSIPDPDMQELIIRSLES